MSLLALPLTPSCSGDDSAARDGAVGAPGADTTYDALVPDAATDGSGAPDAADASATDALADASSPDTGKADAATGAVDADADGHGDAAETPDAADVPESPDSIDADVPSLDAATPDATADADASLPDVDGYADAGDATIDAGWDTTWDADTQDTGPDAVDAWTPDALPWDTQPEPDLGPPVPTVRVRVMAANLTSGNYQSYDPGHGIRIFQGLQPDIVLIQEFNYGTNTVKAVRGMVDLAFGSEFEYFREDLDGAGTIPNGVVSRYPILEAGIWDDPEASNREFAWARIDVPGPVDLYAVSVHLLTKSELIRDKEAVSIAAYVKAHVPDEAYLVLGGDMNTALYEEPALTTLRDALTWTQLPADIDGNPFTNQKRTKPYDWLIADVDLESLHAPVAIGDNEFPTGLVFDSRVYVPLTDVTPIKATDSEAPSMQHMAVVKDFLIPLE